MSFPDTFAPTTQEDEFLLLALHMLGGTLDNAFDINDPLGRLTNSFAREHLRFRSDCQGLIEEADIDNINVLLEDFERSVGIPNQYFNKNANRDRRRLQAKSLYSKFGGAQTEADFIRIAADFGVDIQFVDNGLPPGKERAHTWKIQILSQEGNPAFPLEFPIVFAQGQIGFITQLFNTLAPANHNVIVE